ASYTSLHVSLRLIHLYVIYFIHPPTPEISTLSLHDALPICGRSSATWKPPKRPAGLWKRRRPPTGPQLRDRGRRECGARAAWKRSEEHTSELQSRENLVCRLLLEKKNKMTTLMNVSEEIHRN